MKEVIAIIRAEKWQPTKEVLDALGVGEVANFRVLGRGLQRGLRYLRRVGEGRGGPGTTIETSIQFLPKRMLSWLVPDEKVDQLVAALIRVNQTGNVGDGKIFVCPVDSIFE